MNEQELVPSESLPPALRDALVPYVREHGLHGEVIAALAGRLIEAFGISKVGEDAHRRAVWLCVLATRRVLFGWNEMECEGDAPARGIDAAAEWARKGTAPEEWKTMCEPAAAVRSGEPIDDCDLCRAEPIASAAAHTVRFAQTASTSDAVSVLQCVRWAGDEGIEWPDAMPFREWIAKVAMPAALELRPLAESELRS